MAINYDLNYKSGEILYCGLHDKRWEPNELSYHKCPWCNNHLVSWYTKLESKDKALAKWKDKNPQHKNY